LRAVQKYAVRVGGGVNHRFGLDDAVLIKDNHIAVAGGIRSAIERVRVRSVMWSRSRSSRYARPARGVLAVGVRRGAARQQDPKTLRQAVVMVGGRALTEASGRITPRLRLRGRDGRRPDLGRLLTHSATALDIGLDHMK